MVSLLAVFVLSWELWNKRKVHLRYAWGVHLLLLNTHQRCFGVTANYIIHDFVWLSLKLKSNIIDTHVTLFELNYVAKKCIGHHLPSPFPICDSFFLHLSSKLEKQSAMSIDAYLRWHIIYLEYNTPIYLRVWSSYEQQHIMRRLDILGTHKER